MVKVLKFLFDIFCPRTCVACGQWGNFICEVCGDSVVVGDGQALKLAQSQYLDGVWAVAQYQGVMKILIKQLKYKHLRDLAAVGGHYIWQMGRLPKADWISFVPIHRRRYLERGFNQSRALAEEVSRLSALPLYPLLKRVLYREKQAASKDLMERLSKIRGVFALSKQVAVKDLAGKKIVLIDDVVTTGSTLNECARVLKKAGVAKVWAVCLAHGQ